MADEMFGWRSRVAHRGHSRRSSAAHGEQSSSEYSSPGVLDNGTRLSPRRNAADRSDGGHAAHESNDFADDPADQNENLGQYRRGHLPSDSHGEEGGYPTSGDSGEPQHGSNHTRRHDTDEIMELSPGSIKGRRGKKGLTHAEMAIMGRRATDTDSGSNETENDDAGENLIANGRDHDIVQADDGVTEDDSEDYREPPDRLNEGGKAKQRRSGWSEYHPVVLDAMKMLRARGAEPSELSYARLAGAGKGAVDYMVRKQSITIGRSASLADCAIKSEGRLISRKHARLFWKNDTKEWAIRCLSERNGVVVNGVPVVPGSESMSVRSRDLIELGDVAFFFLAATTPVVYVDNIPVLERAIRSIREQEDRELEEFEEHRRRSTGQYGRALQGRHRLPPKSNRQKVNGLERKKRSQDAHRPRSKAARLERSTSSRKRPFSVVSGDIDNPDGLPRSRKRWRHPQKPRSRSGGTMAHGADADESDVGRRNHGDPYVTEEDGYDQRQGLLQDERSDGPLSIGGGKVQLHRQRELMSNENKRKKKASSLHKGDDSELEQSSKHREDWNKKERTDFGRALFAVGVDPIVDADGSVEYYDWTRFRKIAELSKKSDLMLEDYYIRMMADVHSLLEEEEREKRTKGPRTKHKPGCDCIVCENTRKSRRKKREERDHSYADEGANGDSDLGEDADVKSTAKSNDKLVGLVTAQKLRVRLSIHEAARQVMYGAGKAVFEKLREQQVRDFPGWWRPGFHDQALMRGTAIHGVGQWSDIWNDRRQKAFRKQKERYGSSITWPSNQAAMKRVREISSAINAELRREAKRAAKGEQELCTTNKRMKPKRTSKKHSVQGAERSFSRRRKSARATEVSGDEYEEVGSDGPERDPGESTAESGSENEVLETQGVSEILIEDDDDVLEMEVEEEMEIEEEVEDAGDETEDEDGKVGHSVGIVVKKESTPVADVSTDEEEDDEDNIQYETASDSGSE